MALSAQEGHMRGQDVREVFETVLPSEVLDGFIDSAQLQKRARALRPKQFIRAAIISASTPHGGRQADILRTYFSNGSRKVARGCGYAWFNEGFETVMKNVRERALEYARSLPLDLPGFLKAEVKDWHIVDSTTVALDESLKAEYPGTGDYAALKLHKRFSVGVGTTYDYHLSPAREHDSKHLELNESWRGLGLLVDLGYASHQLLRDCDYFDTKYVLRLKENWKVKVDKIKAGELTGKFLKGVDFDALIGDGTLKLGARPIDLEVSLGNGESEVKSRLVGVRGPKGWCWYLTNLSQKIKPRQILDLYRVRWEIESNNKLDKSCLKLAQMEAKKGCVVRALVDAAMVGSIMICLLVHHHRLRETKPRRKGTERAKAPVHPQVLAKILGVAASRVAAALDLTGEEAEKEWKFLAELLEHQGSDPNWRRRPSVLDQLRGWKISPGQPKRKRAASTKA